MSDSTTESFRADLCEAGLKYAGPIESDGKLHRFKACGDENRNSWFVLFSGSPAAGAYGCWKRGFKKRWRDKNNRDCTAAELETIRRRWEDAERQRELAEATRREQARKTAAFIVQRSKPADDRHPYLLHKGIRVFGDLREYKGALILALRDATGGLHSLQFIGADGSKRFLLGGRVAGCLFGLGPNPVGPLVICEGYATAASIHQATGFAVVCALNCGNLTPVSKALRAKWPEREILIAADNDQFTDGNPGLTKAAEAAKDIRAQLAVPEFADVSSNPTDFNDLASLEGLGEVKRQIEAADTPKETDEEIIARLAKLSLLEYERARESAAKQLNCRTSVLDELVGKKRPMKTDSSVNGSPISFKDVEPWDNPVSGAELLGEIKTTLRRYVVLSDIGLTACALFVVHTYAFDLGDVSPILMVTGPTKRCGKSRLLSILARLVNRPLTASSASAAGIYRTIELYRPTLLIDEFDSFLRGDEQLRGLINSGHTRTAAFHLGCGTKENNFEPQRWSTWTPKILSGIGRLADTIEDRAFVIHMRRRKKDEAVERLRDKMRFEDLRRKCSRFVTDNADAVREADPEIPAGLNDRAADNWLPLFAIADIAAPEWAIKARQAAAEVSADNNSFGQDTQLLADIQQIFDESHAGRIFSKMLVQSLGAMIDRPWPEAHLGKPITEVWMARRLKSFGIAPRTVRVGSDTAKGYHRADFDEAFDRYLSDQVKSKRHSVTTTADVDDSSISKTPLPETMLPIETSVSTNTNAPCDAVSHEKAQQTRNCPNALQNGGPPKPWQSGTEALVL